MLDQHPSEALIDWAEQIGVVKLAQDRPWFYTEPPEVAWEHHEPKCTCKKPVTMKKFPCEDNNGYVYIGQCGRCEKIIWTVLECAGK